MDTILSPWTDERVVARFWAKVDKRDGHWLWTASKTANGAGQFAVHPGETWRAHRFAWTLLRGELGEGMRLVRTEGCPRHECVNPDCHVEMTVAETSAVGGRLGGRSKTGATRREFELACPPRAVELIRAMHERSMPLKQILVTGERLGLGPAAVQYIIAGVTP